MKYKAILFDGDGVTLRSSMLFSEQLNQTFGISMAVVQPFFTGAFLDCSIGKAELKQELAKVVGDWGWKGTVDELLDFWFTKGTEVNQEALTYIQSLPREGVRLFLASDQETYRAERVWKLLGRDGLFERLFYSAEMGVRKTSPAFFESVYQELLIKSPDLQKSEVLLIDDGEKNVVAAKAFGFDAHFYTTLEELKTFLLV